MEPDQVQGEDQGMKKEDSNKLPQYSEELLFSSSFQQSVQPVEENEPKQEAGGQKYPMYFDSYSYIRGTSHAMLNAIQSNYLPPLEISQAALNPPPISLSLHHSFGYEFSSKRNTVVYCGVLEAGSQLCYSRKGYKRRIVFISDRLAVQTRATNLIGGETRPKDLDQRHYEAHINKISCIAVHPDRQIIATGEASNISWIFFWEYKNLQTQRKIQTLHSGGIINMVFSFDGKYVASLGMANVFNIQITEWGLEKIVAFRSVTNRPVLDIRFDPVNSLKLAICGVNFVEFLKIKGSNLESYLLLSLDSLGGPVATCMDFFFFQLGNKLRTELMIGGSSGDLYIASLEKEAVSVALSKAHSAPVTHIKISCCLSTLIRIFTAGDDGFVKIWSSRLKLIRSIDLRREVIPKVNEFIDDTPVHMNPNMDPSKIAILRPQKASFQGNKELYEHLPHEYIQSMDLWHKIEKSPGEETGKLPYVLISTKSGFIIEILLEPPTKPKLQEENPTDCMKKYAKLIEPMIPNPKEENPQKEFLQASLIFRSQQSTLSVNKDTIVKKQFCSVHPFRPFIAIIASNEELIVWDFDKKIILVKLQFDPAKPSSALKWHPKEDFFLIGFKSGMIHIYQIQENLSIEFKKELKVCLDGFLHPVADSPILNIEFNSNGDLLAVSYGNSKESKDDSFVQVYISRNRTTVDDINLTSEGKYLHYFDIRSPSIQSTFEGQLRSYGMGVYFMNFSSDSRFILVCFQLIDSNLQRNNKNNQGIYILWDIKLNSAVKSWEGQKESTFRHLQFANHTIGRYRFFRPNPKPLKKKQLGLEFQEPAMFHAPVTFSSICQLTTKDEPVRSFTPLFLGDEAGFIHITSVSSLYSPENREDSAKECLASMIRAHSTGVDWIGLSGDGRWLFTRGVGDNSIIMWRIDSYSFEAELDYLKLGNQDIDVFGEVPALPKLDYCISSILSKRLTAGDISLATSSESEGEIFMKLRQVIGRTALTMRNNICYSNDNQLIFTSGSILILLSIPNENHIPERRTMEKYFKQSFIKPADYWKSSPAPELGAIQICHAHKLLCISTYEKTSRLLFWRIESKSFTGTLTLMGFNFVMMMRFAEDNRTLGVVALTSSYTASILIVDCKTVTITATASMSYSVPFKIKDFSFEQGVSNRFCTVGVNHIRLWTIAGSNCFGQNLDIGNKVVVRREEVRVDH
jgi:WD40 repeat protein